MARPRPKRQRSFQFGAREAISSLVETVLKKVGQHAFTEVLRNTPVEEGHAHEAWLTAAAYVPQIDGAKALADAGVSKGELSGDPNATAGGHGSVELTQLSGRIRLTNKLGFVKIIEHGGILRPISPGGRKEAGKAGIGTLFGARQAAPPQGMIMWRVGGRTMFARQLDYPARHPVADALAETKAWYDSQTRRS